MKTPILTTLILTCCLVSSCVPKDGNILSQSDQKTLAEFKDKNNKDNGNGNGGGGGAIDTPTPTPTPTSGSGGGGSGGSSGGAGKAAGCTATPGTLCQGGYASDSAPKDLKVKIVYGNPAGGRLTTDPLNHARTFINSVNANYIHDNHRYMNLKLDESKVIEVAQESDTTMINKYTEDGYVTMILVAEIPGSTAGYVQHMCAELQKKQAWTVFEFPLVAAGVVEHEVNHLFCFPHTSSQNGGDPNTFLGGYNTMQAILSNVGAYKKPFTPLFKLYVDKQNRSNASVTNDGMVYYTGNLMYYSVLPQKPKLFTSHGVGYPYSYSHLLDYYYWNFIKPYAK
jgi:hypothetical protein